MIEETELISRLKASDRSAFEELLNRYEKNVLNICFRFLLNKEDAEDVAQEVFVEVYHGIKNFRGDAKLSTWIYRIATTRSLDAIKKQNRKKRISSIGSTLGIEEIIQKVAGNNRPDHALEDKDNLSRLMQALNKLPENQRVALTLSKIEGYNNTEVAELMETTLSAVDSLIFRAKQNLKSNLSS